MVVCLPLVVPSVADGVNESRYVAAATPPFVMRMSERNGTMPSRCATAGTISASLGGAPFGVAVTGVTRLIETVLLVLVTSLFDGAPLPLETVSKTVPVFAPTGRLPGLPVTVTVTVPFAGTVPDAGLSVRYGLSVAALNVAPGGNPVKLTCCVTCAVVVPSGTTRSKSFDVAACCGTTTICAVGPNVPATPPQETGRTR